MTSSLLALLLGAASAPSTASPRLQAVAARLEGRVLGLDGRPAGGFVVHAIDAEGRTRARAATDADGGYVFAGLPPGPYALGVESPDGKAAPVTGSPLRLGARELARRDLRLMATDPATRERGTAASPGLRSWWGELSTAAKVWVVVAVVVVGGLTAAALDDDPREQAASPSE